MEKGDLPSICYKYEPKSKYLHWKWLAEDADLKDFKMSKGRTVAFMEGNKKGRLSEHVMFADPALDKPLWVCLLNYSLAAKTSIFGQRGCDKNL